MEQKELTIEEKMMKAGQLSLDIARLRKLLNNKQREFNKIDYEIYLQQQKEQKNEPIVSADSENN